MPISVLAPVAALLYLAATGLHLLQIFQQRQGISPAVLGLGLVALLCHAVVAWDSIQLGSGISLGFYKVSALIFLVINVICALLLLRRPLQNLLVLLFPLSAMSVLVSAFAPSTASISTNLSGGLLLHVFSSILAYAVFTLAAAQGNNQYR